MPPISNPLLKLGSKMENENGRELNGRRAGNWGHENFAGTESCNEQQWRSIMSHKWNKSKKSSPEAWILDVSQAFHVLSFSRTDSTRIPTFTSVLRGLSSYYDMKESFRYLVGEVLEDHEVRKYGCHANGTRTRNIHLFLTAVPLWCRHLSCNSSPLIIRMIMNGTGEASKA